MDLYSKLLANFPTLTANDFHPITGTILIQNDANGNGDYIAKWNYTNIPKPDITQLKD